MLNMFLSRVEIATINSIQDACTMLITKGREREREREGLYVQSTQIGYIRTSKAWKKEKY